MVSLATQKPAAGAADRHGPTRCHAYRLADGWVVADLLRDRLMVLNETAFQVWSLWQDKHSIAAISAELARHYEVDTAQVWRDVEQAILAWQAPTPAAEQAGGNDWRYPTGTLLDTLPAQQVNVGHSDHALYGLGFRLHYATDAIRQAVAPLFAHLAGPTDGHQCTDYHLEQLASGYRLRNAQRVIYQGASLDLVAINLLNEVGLAGHREHDNLCVLHAAAVARGDACILLPGVAGAGKSTLTAALLHHGLEYLSDDMVPIDAVSRRAIPLSPPLCIKAGSVALLGSRYPALPESRVYQRDDQPVRYLTPPDHSLAPLRDRRVQSLIFPRYQPGAEAGLTEIPASDAFQRLLDAGIFAHRPRDPERLGELVDWIGGLRSYQLQYDDLDEACRQVSEVLDTGTRATTSTPDSGKCETSGTRP
jgi:hypothetical protein